MSLTYTQALLELMAFDGKDVKITVDDIFKIVEKTSGTVEKTAAGDTFLLYSGNLADGSRAASVAGAIASNVPGYHDILSSPVGRLLDSTVMDRVLKKAICGEFGVSSYDAAADAQKALIDGKYRTYMDGVDSLGNRLSSPYSLWDVAPHEFVKGNNGS